MADNPPFTEKSGAELTDKPLSDDSEGMITGNVIPIQATTRDNIAGQQKPSEDLSPPRSTAGTPRLSQEATDGGTEKTKLIPSNSHSRLRGDSELVDMGGLGIQNTSHQNKGNSWMTSYLCTCCTLTIVTVAVTAAVASFAMFGVNYSENPHSITSVQMILQGDTIPVYLTSKTDLPSASYDTSSYNSVNVSANPNQLLPIKVLFVNGDAACTPSANDTRHHTSADIPLSPDAEPVFVIKNMFFAPDSIFTANFSIVNTNNNTGAVTLDIFDNKKSYEQCLVSDELHSTSACRAFKKFSFPIVDGMTKTINYTFPEASYYFMLLSASVTVNVQYTYKLSYKYYRLADYTPTSSCTIEDDDPKPCLMKLNSTRGCLFVNLPSPVVGPPSFTDMNVTVTYKQKTLQNGSLLAPLVCGVLAVAVFGVFAVLFTVCCCIKKHDRLRTGSYSQLPAESDSDSSEN